MAADTIVEALRSASIEHPDRVLLLPLEVDGCRPVELAGSGRMIWEAISERPGTMTELVAGLAEKNGRAPTELEADVVAFVDSLVTVGLVRRTGPGAAAVGA
ncbi:PqqD family protein [Subtercola boreus]|nr:PqqD family protein [Subtercola boreus]